MVFLVWCLIIVFNTCPSLLCPCVDHPHGLGKFLTVRDYPTGVVQYHQFFESFVVLPIFEK